MLEVYLKQSLVAAGTLSNRSRLIKIDIQWIPVNKATGLKESRFIRTTFKIQKLNKVQVSSLNRSGPLVILSSSSSV